MKSSDWLKQKTQAKHHQIDRHSVVSRLVAKDMSEAEYGPILVSLHLWLQAMKHYLAPLKLAEPYRLETKLVQLENDIATLGYETQSLNTISPHNEPHAFCLGVHYVIEGSTLGAQFIAPRIEETLARQDVTHFYRGYGARVMPHWQGTRERIDSELNTDLDRENARKGAVLAFDSLVAIIDQQVRLPDQFKELGGRDA